MIKKHFAVYRDGQLLIRTKKLVTAKLVIKDFSHTGRKWEIRKEEIVTVWTYAKRNGDFGYTKNLA